MTPIAAIKFAEGYNAKADSWNDRISDEGKCPFKGSKRLGYETARRHILSRQFKNEQMNGGVIIVKHIAPSESEQTERKVDAWFEKASGLPTRFYR